MLQSNQSDVKSTSPASSPNSYNPVKTTSAPIEQATIGRTLVIKGELSGAEALYIDGRVEGKITLPDHRVTIGRNGSAQANITAREVVVMGKVNGNIDCSDRVDIRSRRHGHWRRVHHAHQRGRRRRAQGRHPGKERRAEATPGAVSTESGRGQAGSNRTAQDDGCNRQRVRAGRRN